MFIAYEATIVIPETLGLILSRMKSEAEAERWAQSISQALNAARVPAETRWIVFNCSYAQPFDASPTDHLIMTNQYLLETFYVARSFEHLHWITPKK